MTWIAIEASTDVGTVAVLQDGRLVGEGEARMKGRREERLMPAVLAILQEAGCAPRAVSAVVCGCGPGSFTSLRIAGAIAKGIVVGSGCALYTVSSLALLVAGTPMSLNPGRYLTAVEALRGELYASLFDIAPDGRIAELANLGRIREGDVARVCAREHARALGPGQELEAKPHARGVARLIEAIEASGRASVDEWEPSYGRLAEAQVNWEAVHGRELAP